MEQKKISKYLIITFAISWISWGILAILISNNILTFTNIISTIIFTIGGFGPTIAAILSFKEKISFKVIWNFIFAHKKKTLIYLLLFCVALTVSIGLSSMEINSKLPMYMLPLILLQAVFIGGGNEELGWRGLMQPELEKKFPFPVATLITGVVWSIWHLPLWFVNGSTQQSIPFISFSMYTIILSFIFAGVYKKTNSVFYCCVLHGLSNFLLAVFVMKVNWIFIVGFIIQVIIAIILWYKSKE